MIISRHHPVLGTFLEIRILDELDDDTADEVDELVVNEMLRLQSIFNRFDEHSELERWKRGELEKPGDELTQLLVTALNWEQTSGGTFSTASRELTELWQSADTRGTRPTPAELNAATTTQGWRIDERRAPGACATRYIIERNVEMGAMGARVHIDDRLPPHLVLRYYWNHPQPPDVDVR